MIRLRRVLRGWLSGRAADASRAPLLPPEEVAQLLAQGARTDLLSGAPASAFVAGDVAARRPGSGMEFDDNRPYAIGDDARFINWRLTARTGSPYVKVFREEHRPCAFVVLDRRAGMRFATVGRLKAQQAAAAAIVFAAAAVRRGVPAGGLILEADPRWLEPRPGEQALRHLTHGAAAAAPPLPDRGAEPTLNDMLMQLSARLRPGCDILLLSDFIDLTESSLALLLRLTAQHRIRALRIWDPAEMQLPEAGALQLAPATGGAGLSIDTGRTDLRQRFAQLAQVQWQRRADWFAAAGIALQSLSTAEPFLPEQVVA